MNSQIVKRNYLFFVLQMLKEKTAEDGEHLSAEDITALMKKEYGLEPNRKTIYTVISDLQELGFDVHLQKGGYEPGYYLGKRELSEAELNLLIDGIESLDNLTSDEKTDIYEKLCKIIGYPSKKIDNYLYARKDSFNDQLEDIPLLDGFETTMEKLDIINKAIRENKQLWITTVLPWITGFLYKEMDEETLKRWENSDDYFTPSVSPYKLFRNKKNEICLLFILTFEGVHYPGFIRVTSIDDVSVRDKKRAKVNEAEYFPDDLSEYEGPRDYMADQELFYAVLIPGPGVSIDHLDFDFIASQCEKAKKVTDDKIPAMRIEYKRGKEESIVELVIECAPNVVPLRGSHLYERLDKVHNDLGLILHPEDRKE